MLKVELKKELKVKGDSPSKFDDYDITIPSGELTIGSHKIAIKPSDPEKTAEPIPDNTVMLTKIYHEDKPAD